MRGCRMTFHESRFCLIMFHETSLMLASMMGCAPYSVGRPLKPIRILQHGSLVLCVRRDFHEDEP